ARRSSITSSMYGLLRDEPGCVGNCSEGDTSLHHGNEKVMDVASGASPREARGGRTFVASSESSSQKSSEYARRPSRVRTTGGVPPEQLRARTLVSIFLAVLIAPELAFALPIYPDLVPNTAKAYSSTLNPPGDYPCITCHNNPSGGNGCVDGS